MPLNVKFIQYVKKAGRYSDGRNGLYLQVKNSGLKSWVFRYSFDGRRREMGLGHINKYLLTEARNKAQELSFKVKYDKTYDPIAEREQEKQKQQLALKAKIITFQICMNEFITFKKAEWTNEKHAQQWTNTLTTYAVPFIGELDIKDIETSHIKELLQPIWATKTETATRVRNRIEQIINYAIALDYRKGDNPARWRGHLDKMLPKPSKITKVKHHPALAYKEIHNFYNQLREIQSISAYALEFLILTASRTGSIIKAQWSEIDFENKLWTVPMEHMKTKKKHEVPLNKRAMELLKLLYDKRTNDFIFVGQSKGGGLSNAAMDKLLQKTT